MPQKQPRKSNGKRPAPKPVTKQDEVASAAAANGNGKIVKRGVEMIPQPQGGLLFKGGVPGNKGGGRPKERVRRRALKVTNEAIAELHRMLGRHKTVIAKIIDGQPVEKHELISLLRAGDVARITEVGGKLGLEEKQGAQVVVPVQIIIRREA